ncbi:MFS transporter [Streptomyces sp. NPDC016562]|uniref:MFS transporter n=1 Tax=Streptomyces sp. NPDC016562 TaxID=3364966 RepID=UPI0036F52AB5
MEHQPLTLPRRYAATAVVCSGFFLLGLDLTVLNVAIPDIQRRLEPSIAQVQWIIDGYALVLGGTVLALGAATDRIGRRRAFVIGLALCGATGVIGAVASNPAQIIAARCGMGAGAALLMPATLSVVTDLFPEPALRRRAIALWAAVGSAGGIAGPLIGGRLVEDFSWRAGFWINLPVAAVVIALAMRLVPESRAARPARIDVPGAMLSTGGLLALVWAIIEAPARGWASGPVITGYTVAALLLCAFVTHQSRAAEPMLPLRLLATGRIRAGACALAVTSFGVAGALFMMTLYLQTILGYSPWQAGLHTLPLLAALGVGAVLALPLLARGDELVPITLGLALMTAAFAVMAGTGTTSAYPRLALFQVIAGLATGLVAASGTEAVMKAVPSHQTGLGSAINDASRQIGSSLGVAVQGSLLTTVFTSHVETLAGAGHLPPDALHHLAAGTVRGARPDGDAEPLREGLVTTAQQAFIDGMTSAATAAGAVTLAATLAAAYVLIRSNRPEEQDKPALRPHAMTPADG